ncbi:MAG: 2-hydroxyacid dehydrogenase [Alphaproteobacteria bacterium]|nr:2-hydroxyacid dehydrogenase [Alphaproteobacteria bacterium]
MTKPVVLMTGPFSEEDVAALERDYEIHKLWEQKDQAAFFAQHGPRIRAIATRAELGARPELLAQLPNVEMVSSFGVGLDAIDFPTCKARGIKVSYTPGVLTEEVADLTIALMLGIARQLPQADAFMRRGEWVKGHYPLVTRMYGKRLGILGMGQIGQAIAKRAASFSMPVSYHARHQRSDVAFPYHATAVDLARNSDFLVVIVPGGAATEKLVNADVLTALGPKGFLVNVARGSVVDEEALLTSLENKAIAGAALDVFWNERDINRRFFALDNVVLHPHGGSATVETRGAMGKLVRDNLAAHFAGKPLLTPVG